MKKIPTLFERDPADMKHVLPIVNPGCEWVMAGEGVATRKYDGTCVLIRRDGMAVKGFARREVKPGKEPPPGWVEADSDEVTGKRVGWEPIAQSGFTKFYDEAVTRGETELLPGTYELCGPRINGESSTTSAPRSADARRPTRSGTASAAPTPTSTLATPASGRPRRLPLPQARKHERPRRAPVTRAYVTAREASDRLGCSIRQIRLWVRQGRLESFLTADRRRLILLASVERCMELWREPLVLCGFCEQPFTNDDPAVEYGDRSWVTKVHRGCRDTLRRRVAAVHEERWNQEETA